MDACPLCFERLHAANLALTPCAHSFCKSCLDKWTASASTCPLCRSSLTELARASSTAVATRVQADVLRVRERPTRTLQYQLESEERRREEAREQRARVEQRIEGYQTRVFTPSGRPFESLPLISVAEMRDLGRQNKRSLLSTRSGLGHGLNDC